MLTVRNTAKMNKIQDQGKAVNKKKKEGMTSRNMIKMEIIEQKISGKTTTDQCEDGIVVNDYYVAVIDGSTSKTNYRIDKGMTNGKYCMLAISEYMDIMSPDLDVEEFCWGVTDHIRYIYQSNGIDLEVLKKNPAMRMTASAVVYSRCNDQIWMIGDCQCMVDGQIYLNPKPGEKLVAAKRAEFINKVMRDGVTQDDIMKKDIGREAIIPILKESCLQQNISYSVIDGFDIPIEFVKVIDTKINDSEIVLASDGYPKLKSTLYESEKELKRLLATDPLCINENIATKGLSSGQTSFDDRSYLRFKI